MPTVPHEQKSSACPHLPHVCRSRWRVHIYSSPSFMILSGTNTSDSQSTSRLVDDHQLHSSCFFSFIAVSTMLLYYACPNLQGGILRNFWPDLLPSMRKTLLPVSNVLCSGLSPRHKYESTYITSIEETQHYSVRAKIRCLYLECLASLVPLTMAVGLSYLSNYRRSYH